MTQQEATKADLELVQSVIRKSSGKTSLFFALAARVLMEAMVTSRINVTSQLAYDFWTAQLRLLKMMHITVTLVEPPVQPEASTTTGTP